VKLVVFLCLIIILVIPVNIPVHAQNDGIGAPIIPPAQEEHLYFNATEAEHQLQQQIQKNVEQRAHYLEIIRSLVILSLVLGFVVIGLGVILYKKRNLKMKSNPET